MIDPFALPASTSSRFVLLLACVLAATAYAADITVAALIAPNGWTARYSRCDEAADAVSGLSAEQITTDFLACQDGVSYQRVWLGAIAVAVLVIVLGVAHWLHPWVVRRRGRLRPINPVTYPEAAQDIAAVLRRSADQGELPRPVQVMVAPFRPAPTGRAFGRARRCTIWLNRGLVRRTDAEGRAHLRAVLRHELAHVRNGDVALTSLAVLSAWATVAVTVPLVAALAWRVPAELPRAAVGWAVLLAVMVLTRTAVVRSREHYADVRAATAGRDAGEPSFLAEAFPDPPPRTGRWARWYALVRQVTRLHPSRDQRRRVVQQPERLLVADPVEAFATGVVAQMTIVLVKYYADLLLRNHAAYAPMLTGIIEGALCSAVVGPSLWRATLRNQALGRQRPDAVFTALALTAGFETGALLSPIDIGEWEMLQHHTARWATSLLIFTATYLVVTTWFVAAARCWLPSPHRRWAHPAGTAIGALFLGDMTLVYSNAMERTDPLTSLHTALNIAAMNVERQIPFVAAAVYLLLPRSGTWRRPWIVTGAAPAAALVGGGMVLLPRFADALVPSSVTGWLSTPSPGLIPQHLSTTLTVCAWTTAVTAALLAGARSAWVRFAVTLVATLLTTTTLALVLEGAQMLTVNPCLDGKCLRLPFTVLILDLVVSWAVQTTVVPLAAICLATTLLKGALTVWGRRRRSHEHPSQRPPRQPTATTKTTAVSTWRRWMRRGAVTTTLTIALFAFTCQVMIQTPLSISPPGAKTTFPPPANTLDAPEAQQIIPSNSVPAICTAVTKGAADGVDAQQATQPVGYQKLALVLLTGRSRALGAFGRVIYDSVRSGDSDRRDVALYAARSYCARPH